MVKYLVNLVMLLGINTLMCAFLDNFRIFNVLPCIFIVILTVISANSDIEEAAITGFMIGIITDMFYAHTFGFNTFIYMWLGIGIHFITKHFLNNEPESVATVTCFSIVFYELMIYVFMYLLNGKTFMLTYTLHIIIPEIIYTAIVFIPLYAMTMKYRKFVKNM